MNEAVMTAQDIIKALPHRYPFLLIDRVVNIREVQPGVRVGRKITAIKNVTINEPFFEGHFPETPVMPGVLLIECMAQAGALAYFRKSDPPMDVAIVGIREAKFRKPVVPGDILTVEAEILKDRTNMILLKCQITVDGKLATEAEIMAYVGLKGSVHQA